MMRSFSTSKTLLLLSSTLLLGACSSLPDDLRASSDAVITDYATWVNTPINEQDEVRLGGVIASVTNLADKTRIEIVNLPISSSGRPDIDREPQGRFVGYVDGFVDPVAYAKDRLVTLVGTSLTPEKAKVGEFEYTFPTMAVKGLHLWRVEERVVVNDLGTYMYPCHSLYCRQMYIGAREGRVVQEVK
ncbi:Slp family lipoprotein [Vibrio anguillarum]|uniref:Slp family lipoprotein n=1 Tax=Vibrio anguillarum TaxID=55601 RepID=UPI00097E3CE2|nr:Slp family lipoprotein [Vibrio anguillarum]AQM19890.1 starvation-inducible protein [Vibrio anguillarum]AUB88289.1 starvation-inducible protein [Vibrio anguillarum]AUB91731.1 starvation-inducible protein [Vibrio anguillarum]AUB95169.1 starvation-inducible protein [Vibrio anguillarum]AUB98585.1 starvation-inducible protein [Vibrio anguillarum]